MFILEFLSDTNFSLASFTQLVYLAIYIQIRYPISQYENIRRGLFKYPPVFPGIGLILEDRFGLDQKIGQNGSGDDNINLFSMNN